ncbi:MAG: M23 family metallopeptidase [Clostridia bacterium]|nr:M23 family metallopeptidase [Clostridia bacterium]
MKKNRFLAALLIILLFIPTYIGVANYLHVSKTPVSANTATDIIIKDLAGKTYEAESDSDIATLFARINENAIKVEGLPAGLMDAENYVVTFTEGKRTTDNRYYFSKNTAAVYYLDSTGAAFMVNEADAAEFLETKYAQSVYEEAYLPTLVNGTNTILPSSYEWAYRTLGEKDLASTVSDTTENAGEFTSENGLSFEFSRKPDTFNITVKNNAGETLYNGNYDEITAVDTKKYPELTIDIDASWLGTEEVMSGGKASYSFALNVEAQPEFLIAYSGEGAEDYEKFVPGDLAFITAIGIDDPENISVSITPELTHDGKAITPKFFVEGKHSYAILPTSYDTAAGEYTLKFTYEGAEHTLTMVIESKKFGVGKDFAVSQARVNATRTEDTLAAYDEMVAGVLAESDFTVRHFDNTSFVDPDGNDISVRGYGVKRTISSTREAYTNKGIDYTMSTSENVLATMNGEVVYVGNTAYAGTAVAISHGYGLISWYHNVDDVKVNKGDIVTKGSVIAGKVSDSGFTDGSTLHYRLTVYDVPVCAYDLLWSDTDGDDTGDVGITFKQ